MPGRSLGAVNRLLAYRVVPELAALWLVELLGLFVTLHVAQVAGLGELLPVADGEAPGAMARSLNRAALIASLMGITGLGVGLYRVDVCMDRRRTVIAALLAAILGWALMVVVLPLVPGMAPTLSPLVLAKVPLIWLAWLALTRGLLGWAMRQRLFTRRIVVLGGNGRAARMVAMIDAHRNRLFEVADTQLAPDRLTPDRLTPEALRQARVWAVVVAEENDARIPREHLLACKLAGIRVLGASEFCESQLGRIDLDAADHNWALYAHGMSASLPVNLLRRLSDIAISLVLLAFTLPLILLTAIAIRLDSAGPILYRQTRTGLNGKPFTLFKFRSMRPDAEAAGRPVWAVTDDPRVTRVGQLIRRTRIDELPQLLNVLRGEMSFIGPRPERPEFVAELSKEIPLYVHRACVKPGLTGWAQVSFRYGASVDDARHKLSYDLYYIKHRSALLDLLILMATVRVILFGEGAR